MLISDIPALREYWYPVAYRGDVADSPRRFRIFSQDYVMWRPVPGGPVRAAPDECPHRAASLSDGVVIDGCLTCPYHGWRFDTDGACVLIPANDNDTPIPRRAHLATVLTGERYGLVWVCVGVPRADIPFLPEAEDASYTVIHEMMEEWHASAPRIVDNALDATHVAWAHRGTIGDPENPQLGELTMEPTEGHRLRYRISQIAKASPQLRANNGLSGETARRVVEVDLVNPLTYRAVMTYTENGLVHVLLKTATPVDDGTTLFTQFIARNDAPDAGRQSAISAVDRAVQAEDRRVLERVKPDFPTDITTEVHTRWDRMTIEYRRILAALAAESSVTPAG